MQGCVKFFTKSSDELHYQLPKLHDLTRRIAELTEEIEELKTEKEMLLHSLDCADDAAYLP